MNGEEKTKNAPWQVYVPFMGIVIGFMAVSIFFTFVSPEDAIAALGVENSYAFLFLLAFCSGLLAFSGIPYHWVLIALALGGLNPWLLGLAAAVGVILGDSTSYLIGYYGHHVVPARWRDSVEKLSSFMHRHPRLVPAFFFVYGSIAPFSNDLIGITMGVARYPILRVMVPLGLGNFVFNTSLAFLAVHAAGAIESLSGWLW